MDIVDDVPDNGQHVFASGYVHLMRYLDSVGTRESVCFPGHMTVRMPGGGTRRSAFGGVSGLRGAIGDLPGVTGVDRLRTARAQVTLIRQALKQPAWLDDITADEWFRRIGMPQSARDALWDGIVIGLTGDKPDISSAKVPADLLVTGIRLARRTKTPISIGYPTVDLDTLFIDPVVRDPPRPADSRCWVGLGRRLDAHRLDHHDGRRLPERLPCRRRHPGLRKPATLNSSVGWAMADSVIGPDGDGTAQVTAIWTAIGSGGAIRRA